jgi:adenylate cyclase
MIGDIILKGKAGTTRVYQPVSESEAKVTWLIDYADAYALLASKEPAATPAFEALALRAPNDPLVRFHLDRLKAGETGAEIELVDK